MTSFAAYIPATPTGRWSVALGVALLAHVSVGGGVVQWGYGGAGAGEGTGTARGAAGAGVAADGAAAAGASLRENSLVMLR